MDVLVCIIVIIFVLMITHIPDWQVLHMLRDMHLQLILTEYRVPKEYTSTLSKRLLNELVVVQGRD